jgi:hypothetical protein
MNYPKSLKQFEFFSFLGLVLFLVISYTFWGYALPTDIHYGPPVLELIKILVPSALLIAACGRLRENGLRWGVSLLFVYSYSGFLLQMIYKLFEMNNFGRVLLIVPYVLFFIAFKKLFDHDSNKWFSSKNASSDSVITSLTKVKVKQIIDEIKDVVSVNVNDLKDKFEQSRANAPASQIVRTSSSSPLKKLNMKGVLFLLAASGLILFGFSKLHRSSPSEQVVTAGASSDQGWFNDFKSRTWQEMQGLSCGSNRFRISGDQLVTTQGQTVVSKKYQIQSIDNANKSFVLVMNTYIRDNLAKMFPNNIDDISGSQVYTFQVLSNHKVKLVRKIKMIDLEGMLAGEPLSYLPEEIDTHIIFDCEQ